MRFFHKTVGLCCALVVAACTVVDKSRQDDATTLSAAAVGDVERGRALLFNTPWPKSSGIAPYAPFARLVEALPTMPGGSLIAAAAGLPPIEGLDELYVRFGLGPWPSAPAGGIYRVPFGPGETPSYPVGGGINAGPDGEALFAPSCAGCHARRLFGQVVLGAPNHLQRMRDFSLLLKAVTERVPPAMFKLLTGASAAEVKAYTRARDRLKFVAGVPAPAPGIDTEIQSLLHTLPLRGADPYATASAESLAAGQATTIPTLGDPSIKAGTWWTLKYRNRSYADGMAHGQALIPAMTVVFLSGGVDLQDMETWLAEDGGQKLADMTAAVYATEPPRWLDFFPASRVDLATAKHGQKVFAMRCAGCHGSYAKAWDTLPADAPMAKLVETTTVTYPAEVVRVRVGTDPGRADSVSIVGAKLAALAPLARYGVAIDAEPGAYVPPPLTGIWARWPYFHNGSAATLCDVLTPAAARTRKFYLGPAENIDTDYDQECVGTPRGTATPNAWQNEEQLVDTNKPGLAATGHDEGIFLKDGAPLITAEERAALIMFLKLL